MTGNPATGLSRIFNVPGLNLLFQALSYIRIDFEVL